MQEQNLEIPETLLAGSTNKMQSIPFSIQVPVIARQRDWQSSRLTNHKDKRASDSKCM